MDLQCVSSNQKAKAKVTQKWCSTLEFIPNRLALIWCRVGLDHQRRHHSTAMQMGSHCGLSQVNKDLQGGMWIALLHELDLQAAATQN